MTVSRIALIAATATLIGAAGIARAAKPSVGETLDLAAAAKARVAIQTQLAHGAQSHDKKAILGAAGGGHQPAEIYPERWPAVQRLDE
jgi:hypothetical protein